MDKSNRKRFNSSMNYKEYLDLYQVPPPKPVLRPFDNTLSAIPDFDLDAEMPTYEHGKTIQQVSSKIDQIYRPKVVIQEVEENESVSMSHASKSRKAEMLDQKYEQKVNRKIISQVMGRIRSKSEAINFSFISFMEKGIQRKMSKEVQTQS